MSAVQVRVRMEGNVWTGWGDTPATAGEGSQVGGLMSHPKCSAMLTRVIN